MRDAEVFFVSVSHGFTRRYAKRKHEGPIRNSKHFANTTAMTTSELTHAEKQNEFLPSVWMICVYIDGTPDVRTYYTSYTPKYILPLSHK